MKSTTKRKLRKVVAPFRRIGLKRKRFTILSNNCWGGFIYDYFGLQYQTPTIGLYFSSNDFIKFIYNLDYYLSLDLEETVFNDCKCRVNGKLGDIIIHFVHYKTFEDAQKKWNRRKKRIDKNHLLVKFNDQNNFTPQNFVNFVTAPFENKLFFTINYKYKSPYTVVLKNKKKSNDKFIDDDIKGSLRHIQIKKLLNSL